MRLMRLILSYKYETGLFLGISIEGTTDAGSKNIRIFIPYNLSLEL